MSVEMLQNLIIKNQSEKMALMERKWSIESGEVEEDEDPDMRVMKLSAGKSVERARLTRSER